MKQFFSIMGQRKVPLLLVAALLLLSYAISDLSNGINEGVAPQQPLPGADKAVADKTMKIMDYEPSKVRLVAL